MHVWARVCCLLAILGSCQGHSASIEYVTNWPGLLPQGPQSISTTGTAAIVAGASNVVALDISNPKKILELGRVDLASRVSGQARIGNHLYLSGGSKIAALDVSDLAEIKVVAPVAFESEDLTETIVAGDQVLYCGAYRGLITVDVSDPVHGSATHTNEIGLAVSIHKNGQYLYVSGYNGTPVILDIADPRQPEQVGEFGGPQSFGTWCGFAQEGPLLAVAVNYISGLSSATLLFYNVSKPGQPKFLGYGPEGKVLRDMTIRTGTLYYVSDARIRAYDLARIDLNLTEPKALDVPMIAEATDFDTTFGGLVLARGHVFVPDAVKGVSVWAARLPAKLVAKANAGSLTMDLQLDPAFNYSVETSAGVITGWEGMGSPTGDSLTLPVSAGEQSRFFRLKEIGPAPEFF